MDGTFNKNSSEAFFRPLQAPLNTTDNSFYSLGAAQSNDPSIRINKYDSNGILYDFGYPYDTVFNRSPPGRLVIVAGGQGPNSMAYSIDRLTWTTSTSGSSLLNTACYALAYDGFTWYAGGVDVSGFDYITVGNINRNILQSGNGRDWTTNLNASYYLSIECNAIATKDGLWVAGGYGIVPPIYYSAIFSYDGFTWFNAITVSNIILPGSVATIAQNNQIWLMGGGVNPFNQANPLYSLSYSYDGINWLPLIQGSSLIKTCYALCWSGALWNAGGNDIGGSSVLLYSRDGISWTSSTITGVIPNRIQALSWNGTVWTIGGQDASGLGRTFGYSYDGVNWTASPSTNVFPNRCKGITWDGAEWQAVGDGIATSLDGINWTLNSQGTNLLPQGSVVALNKALPFVAPRGTPPNVTGPLTILAGHSKYFGSTIAYSTDGITWTDLPTIGPQFNNMGDFTLAGIQGLSWNGTVWVAGFDQAYSGQPAPPTVGYSFDAITWSVATSASTIFNVGVNSITWCGDRFLALGGQGTIGVFIITLFATSPDGINWTQLPYNYNSTIDVYTKAVVYNGTIVLCCGHNIGNTTPASILYSYDCGTTWNYSVSAISLFPYACNSIQWNGTLWVGAGFDYSFTTIMGYSYDGINWNQGILHDTPYSIQGNSIAWNGSMFVMGSSYHFSVQTIYLHYSYDGINWYPASFVERTLGLPPPQIFSVAWTGSLWVATGYLTTPDSGLTFTDSAVMYSYNGVSWYVSQSGQNELSVGFVVASNLVNPFAGNKLPPTVYNQGVDTSGGYVAYTSNVNNLYKSNFVYLDEQNGVLNINQTTQTYSDLNNQAIKSVLEISGGAITVNTGSSIPGVYLTSSQNADSGGRIELYDASNQYGWRINNNATYSGQNRFQITSYAQPNQPKLIMDIEPQANFIPVAIGDIVKINPPGNDYYSLAVTGNVQIMNTFRVNGVKQFQIDHPNPALKDTHYLRHCCLEGPTRGDTLYKWILRTQNKTCVQALPSYSPYLNENWQFMVSPTNSFGSGHIRLSEDETSFTLSVSEEGTYYVLGIATRKDRDSLEFDNLGTEFEKSN